MQSFSFRSHCITSLLSVRVIVRFILLDVLRIVDINTVILPRLIFHSFILPTSFFHAFGIWCVYSLYIGRHTGSMKRLDQHSIYMEYIVTNCDLWSLRPWPSVLGPPLMCRTKLNKVRLCNDGWFRRRTCVEPNSGSSWQTVFDEKIRVLNSRTLFKYRSCE